MKIPSKRQKTFNMVRGLIASVLMGGGVGSENGQQRDGIHGGYKN